MKSVDRTTIIRKHVHDAFSSVNGTKYAASVSLAFQMIEQGCRKGADEKEFTSCVKMAIEFLKR